MSDEKQLEATEKDRAIKLSDFGSPVAALLSDDMQEKYLALLTMADKSPIVGVKDMDQWDANQDFIVFYDKKGNGHFDIQRGFALKAMRVFEFGKRNLVTQMIETKDGHIQVQTNGEIFDTNHPDRYTTVSAGCSTKETTARGKSGNTRAFHDAVATAETRLLKRGVEELAGLPIINSLIREIFGGFEIKARELRDVTAEGTQRPAKTEPEAPAEPTPTPPEIRDSIKRIARLLKDARKVEQLRPAEFATWQARAIKAAEERDTQALANIEEKLEELGV